MCLWGVMGEMDSYLSTCLPSYLPICPHTYPPTCLPIHVQVAGAGRCGFGGSTGAHLFNHLQEVLLFVHLVREGFTGK